MPTQTRRERVLERLRVDTPFWSENYAMIVDKRADLVSLLPNAAQFRLDDALEAQREAGEPMRAIVLKSRKVGISTWTVAKVMQRVTSMPNRIGLFVAHDNDTAGVLLEMGRIMHANMNEEIRPPIVSQGFSKGGAKYMTFRIEGQLSARDGTGDRGLNSSIEIDTAREVQAGRGYTCHYLHLSEAAFYPDPGKLVGLLNAVPQEPETMVVIESTANGFNHFKDRWDDAVDGRSRYTPVFFGWTEDPDCTLQFSDEAEREEFAKEVGRGPFGEDEPMLQERFGCTLEQLRWRRFTIVDQCEGKVEVFNAEYPHSPEIAFLSADKQVFSMAYVTRILDRTREITDRQYPNDEHPGPQLGELKPTELRSRRGRHGLVDSPQGVKWVEGRSRAVDGIWRVWTPPQEDGLYVLGVDPASGESNDSGELAYHGLELIDHKTKQQVAEYRSRIDPDLLVMEVLLAALHWNRALIAVEVSGGYGHPITRRLWHDHGYRYMYLRQRLDDSHDRQEDRLGWDTTPSTKPTLIATATEVLRDAPELIRSRLLASEHATYVRDRKGRMTPQRNAHSDLLMAWAIAQQVAREKQPRPQSKESGPVSTWTRTPDPVMNW